MEDQHVDLFIRERRVGGDDPVLNRFLEDPFAIDARAVVLDHDAHALSAMLRAEVNRPAARLAGGLALLGRLDPVVHRVAQHMRERFGQFLDDGAVDFDMLARKHHLAFFVQRRAEIADDPRHSGEDGFHRLRADRHDAFLQLARLARQGLDRVAELDVGVQFKLGEALAQNRLRDHDLADHD